MKRIAVIEDDYVRDTQVFIDDPMYIGQDPKWEESFVDVKRPCQYVGLFEGSDGYEIRCKAADYFGVHRDVIFLIDFEQEENQASASERYEYESLRDHVGHRVEVVTYDDDQNVSVECVDCHTVLYSVDNSDNDTRRAVNG